MEKIMECVANFSEGRDQEKIEQIADAFRNRHGVKLLDYSSDLDHNRTVITAIGEPAALRDAAVDAIGAAVRLIDLRQQHGLHPRIGAADVVPFIPLRGCDTAEVVALARETAALVASRYQLPIYLYEQAASAPHRQNLADVRRGQFEGLAEKMRDPLWQPDFGPAEPHPSAGATAIGARLPLIAFNIELTTNDVEIARAIARTIRHSNGGYRCVKALGLYLAQHDSAQVSINLTDYTQTALYRVVEAVRTEARRYGVGIRCSELIGLIPLQAVADTAAYYLQLPSLSAASVLETHFE